MLQRLLGCGLIRGSAQQEQEQSASVAVIEVPKGICVALLNLEEELGARVLSRIGAAHMLIHMLAQRDIPRTTHQRDGRHRRFVWSLPKR